MSNANAGHIEETDCEVIKRMQNGYEVIRRMQMKQRRIVEISIGKCQKSPHSVKYSSRESSPCCLESSSLLASSNFRLSVVISMSLLTFKPLSASLVSFQIVSLSFFWPLSVDIDF